MDKSTHEVRSFNWATIISQCQSRPEGQSAKQWLAENNIPEKRYYYWLRKLRTKAYNNSLGITQPVTEQCSSAVAFAEIPADDIIPSGSAMAVTIKTKKVTLEISTAVPGSTMIELVKAVANAV